MLFFHGRPRSRDQLSQTNPRADIGNSVDASLSGTSERREFPVQVRRALICVARSLITVARYISAPLALLYYVAAHLAELIRGA